MFNNRTSQKRNRNYEAHGFEDCIHDFKSRFGEQFRDRWRDNLDRHRSYRPSVNIEDSEDFYVLSLYAAGLNKDQFKISLQNDILTISYEQKESGHTSNFIHEEYQVQSFERSFQLNTKILSENISAEYVNGVLVVSLPKDPDATVNAQEIKVG